MNGFQLPLAIRQALGRVSVGNARGNARKRGLSWRLRLRVYEDAMHLLPQGRPMTTILKLTRQSLLRRRKRNAAQQIHRVYLAVEDGVQFAHALGPGLTDMERSMLEIGEQKSKGGLAAAMKEIVETRARIARIQSVAWLSVFDPIIYVLAMYAFFYVVGTQVMPSIELMLPRAQWSGWTSVLDWFGSLGTGFAPVIAALIAIAGGFTVVRALPRWTARTRVVIEQWFFVFTYYRELQGTTWLLGFTAQVKAGVPQADALAQQVRRASPWLASRLRPVYRALVDGHQLGEALRDSGMGFPSPDLIERIGTLDGGEGGLDAMEGLARAHADALEKRMRKLATTIGNVCLMMIFVVIGLVQIAGNGLTGNLVNSVGM
ncbi:type II secretion system F family protein [Paraburkholderia megapolitana]|uniref:type II secretion system F family protein n=1 Tax=Paraburkholderia megapolitana TaxID=420953 RepID=UPI0038BDA5ED